MTASVHERTYLTATTASATPNAARSRIAAGHVAALDEAGTCFFREHADMVAQACNAMATRFRTGGRLLAYGERAQRSDVAHVVVEFVHPVIVGKRALPALALPAPRALDALGRDGDILMVICGGVPSDAERTMIQHASERGMLVLALTGTSVVADGTHLSASFHFAVPSRDALVVQEIHETLYHVLWELVHVFLERGAGK